MRVAERADFRISEQNLEVFDEFVGKRVFRFRDFAVRPAGCFGRPFESAELAEKVRFAVVILIHRVGNFAALERGEFFAEFGDVALVVVDVVDIGSDVVIPAYVDNGAGAVGAFCFEVNLTDEVVALPFAEKNEVLVERTPADKRGVVIVALDRFEPFGEEIKEICGVGVIESPVGVLTPDDIAEFVG